MMFLLFAAALAGAAGAAVPPAGSVQISVDMAQTASHSWDHFAERMVGTSHIAMNERADWREHLTMVARDLGARYVRGHGMFDNDMHVSYARGLNSWVSLDSYVDFLLSIDMRPAFELGFSPDWMAQNNSLVGRGSPQNGPKGRVATGYGYRANMSPPNNTLWAEFISDYAKHLIHRYGEDLCSEFTSTQCGTPNVAPPMWPSLCGGI
jgi:xylan 1,4-beta-xylosidase